MSCNSLPITPEQPGDASYIETLLDRAFGLGRRTKTSYRLREGGEPVPGLSLVARGDGGLPAGAISFWPLRIGEAGHPALLLGPLAVDPALHGKGVGLALMVAGLEAASAQGHGLVILVGDESYYSRAGFARVPDGRLMLPGPVDPARLLWRELHPGVADDIAGLVLSPGRYRNKSPALAVPHQAEQRQQGGEA